MIKYFCIILFFVHAMHSTDRPGAFAYKQRKKNSCYSAKYIKTITKKGRPYNAGRPGGYGWHNGPLSGGPLPQDGPSNNNYFDSLAAMAPIAMAMYCFNSAPKLTMITLTTLLLFIAGSDNE